MWSDPGPTLHRLFPWQAGKSGGEWLDHPWGSSWRSRDEFYLNSGAASEITIWNLGDDQQINIRARALDESGKVMYKSDLVKVKLGKAESEEPVAQYYEDLGCYKG
ncbi:MAG: hypothetical protein OXG92_13090 [Chloroflexi bacterium]|nr:hypothetical protein [Chloroflexota bacterium]MCY3717384.1 hypothetical protein [Chloroflexota bacterium]MDE2651124.1 hypothetical protein [Chloroflexota bacterium]